MTKFVQLYKELVHTVYIKINVFSMYKDKQLLMCKIMVKQWRNEYKQTNIVQFIAIHFQTMTNRWKSRDVSSCTINSFSLTRTTFPLDSLLLRTRKLLASDIYWKIIRCAIFERIDLSPSYILHRQKKKKQKKTISWKSVLFLWRYKPESAILVWFEIKPIETIWCDLDSRIG